MLIKKVRSITRLGSNLMSLEYRTLPKLVIILVVISLSQSQPLHASDIWNAVGAGDSATVASLLRKDPALVNAYAENGYTPLHVAAFAGRRQTAEFLISKGGDVNKKDRRNGVTPLHIAAQKNHLEIVLPLLRNGAQADAKTNAGKTPLEVAWIEDNREIVQTLVSNGANVNSRDAYGQTALHYAAGKGYPPLIQLLISKGVQTTLQDQNGLTALHVAVAKDSEPSAAMLVKLCGQRILNIQDKYGDTPLHYAVMRNNLEIAKILILGNAGLSTRNKKGQTPRNVPEKNQYLQMAQLLDMNRNKTIKQKARENELLSFNNFEHNYVSFKYPSEWIEWEKESFNRISNQLKSSGGELIAMFMAKYKSVTMQLLRKKNSSSFESMLKEKRKYAGDVLKGMDVQGFKYVKYDIDMVELSQGYKALRNYAERPDGESAIFYQILANEYEYSMAFIYRKANDIPRYEISRQEIMKTFKIMDSLNK